MRLRPHFLSRPCLHEAADHDAVVGPDTFLNDAQIIGRQLADCDVFLPRRILPVDDHDIPTRLLGANGRIRYQQRLIGRRTRHADASEHPRRKDLVGICEDRPTTNGAGRAINRVIDEIHAAFMIEITLVN